jgi:sugar-specific transcriptional regulator TrmB
MDSNANLARTLENIGLSAKETSIYLVLLSLQTATAYQIAQHCDVRKPTVYVILEDLRRNGLVLKVPHAKKALFAPRDIAEYIREREIELESVRTIIPQLHALGGEEQPKIFFFNGLNGLKQAANYNYQQMRGKTFCSFYSNLADTGRDVLKFYEEWNKKALADGISFKIVLQEPKDGSFLNDIVELAGKNDAIQIKYLQNYQYPPSQSIEIAEGFMRITNEKSLISTIIDDKATAEAMRHIFNIVWSKGA